jgi:nitric oxide reductase NorQ protein
MDETTDAPYYVPVGNEIEVFESAFRGGLAIMLKGPTGCGKTRFVEHMAHRFGVGLHTVSCHEDITAADLLGRYLLVGGDTQWVDGPLTRAVREGGICYLDEIVEARQDSIVAIHPLADHRRELSLERQGGTRLLAADGFGLVVSYNPGYQSVLKDLKVSTRQRMVAIELGFPPPDLERAIVLHESGADAATVEDLINLAQAIRRLDESGLKEVASTRTLIAAGILAAQGLSPRAAAIAAIAGPLTDDPVLARGLGEMVVTYLSA